MPVQYFDATMYNTDGKLVLELVPKTIGPPPTPTPSPTPSPTPTPSGVTILPLGAQNASLFLTVNQGETYAMPLPFPFSADVTFNVGQGQGLTPTYIQMGISDTPGGNIGFGVMGDPNGGVSIAASLNPVPDRGGHYNKTKVTSDRQYYVSFICPNGGGSISHNWN